MREVVFKNMVSSNSRVKNIFLKEMFERDGVVARTERRCFYYIKEVTPIREVHDLEKWVDHKNSVEPMGKRQFHIVKAHSDVSAEDKLICKIMGTFYAIVNNKVYTIAFLHSFKVRFTKTAAQH
jgi:hypothetical protein